MGFSPGQKKRRILHITTVMSVGGVEMWLIELLRHLEIRAKDADREEFDILLTGGQRHELDDLAASLGATLHYIPFSRRRFPEFVARFRKLLRQRKYSAIHDHQDFAAGWHLLAGAGSLPPVRIVHVHNAPARLREAGRTLIRRRLLRFSAFAIRRFATHVLGTSNQILHQYGFDPARFREQDIRALHCGFDTSRFAEPHETSRASVCEEMGWPPESRIALFVGRLDAFKNAEFALEVVIKAIEAGCDLRFIMVGGGEAARERLESEVRAAGYADRIRLVGRRLDVPRLMAASHCFLFPSFEEGLGMVAVEAQASGLRVMASDTVSREIAVDEELVNFLSLGDGPELWCRELCGLINSPRADSVLSNAAVTRSSFSIENSYAALHSIYES